MPSTVREALDLPSFQRLRRIKQLSTVFLVFPGAVHTRFEHSVGVYHLASRVYQTLKYNYFHFNLEHCWPKFDPPVEIALQLAALFHDVGHGPWSHAFELFTDTNEDYREFSHEKITYTLIKEGFGGYTDIPTFLTDQIERLKRKGNASRNVNLLKPENLAKIAIGFPPDDEEYTFLSNIVSMKPVDVDRMDYLRRDALHTGIETGRFNVWELVHNYTLAPSKEKKGQWVARFEKKAAEGVESLVAARDIAYRKVYYTPIHRTAQEMFVRALNDLVVVKEKVRLDDLMMLTDEELLTVFKEEGTPLTEDVADRIIGRGIYQHLPFKLNVHTDFDRTAKEKWGELVLVKPQPKERVLDWFGSEDMLSRDLRLPPHLRVIFDIRGVPVTDHSEYKRSLFFDYNNGTESSLLDELPHLEATTESLEKRKDYLEKISRLNISMPYEYIREELTHYKTEGMKGGKIPNEDKLVQEIYSAVFPLIITSYMDFLSLKDKEKRDAVSARFKEETISFLKDVIHPSI